MKAAIVILLCSGLWPALACSRTSREAADAPPRETDRSATLDRMLASVRERNGRDYTLGPPEAIDEARYVRIGGIDQWITIRGEDRDNPVLLFLHGGPGDVINPWAYAGFRSWLKAFTLVHWDQRGAGRTLSRNGPAVAETISIERMTRDGVELADMLRGLLKKERILVVGHSWGSLLGVFMVKQRPDLFSAFVGTGQVANPSANYGVAYTELLRAAEARHEQTAHDELKAVGPPPYPDGRGFAVQRKWSNLFEGADRFLASTLGLAMTAPGYTTGDIVDWFEGQGLSAGRLVPRTSALTQEDIAGRFDIPVVVIQGADDYTTPARLAREFVAAIQAPHKEFITIEGAGHFAVFIESDVFLRLLLSRTGALVR